MPFKYNALLGLGLDNTIPLDGAGKIPATYLPSYVDDVEEYNNLAAFPATGETGKIYVAIDTGFVYRWSGSIYVQIGVTAAAGSTTQVQFNDGGAFGGDAGLVFNKATDALTIAGPVVHPLGAAATPSLTFTGDPDTGIYSPGADQLAVSTGGVQQVSVDSAGKVSLTGDIEFSRASPASITVDSGGNIRLAADSANTTAASAVNINVDGLEACDINNAGYLRFNKTNFTGGGVCTQQSDGALYFAGGANTLNSGLNISLAGPSFVSTIGYLMRWNTNNLYQWEKTSDFHVWYTGTGNERMRLDSSGRLGLGTSSADALLTVNGVGAFGAGTAALPSIARSSDLDTGAWFPAANTIAASTAGVERLRIDSTGVLQIAEAGNITVGTTTGTKIGTATTQKIGFYNATPVVQPTAVADATTAVDVITQLNALLAKLRTLGIIAT
jgi:hypothetical protein